MNSSFKIERNHLKYEQLKSLVNGPSNKIKNNYIWADGFERCKGGQCFLITYSRKYTPDIQVLNPLPDCTVPEETSGRIISVLVDAINTNALEPCLKFLKNILDGADGKLDDETCQSCKTCFVYIGKSKTAGRYKTFDSLILCLKEAARLVNSLKTNESWKSASCKSGNENNEIMPILSKIESNTSINTLRKERNELNCSNTFINSYSSIDFGNGNESLNDNFYNQLKKTDPNVVDKVENDKIYGIKSASNRNICSPCNHNTNGFKDNSSKTTRRHVETSVKSQKCYIADDDSCRDFAIVATDKFQEQEKTNLHSLQDNGTNFYCDDNANSTEENFVDIMTSMTVNTVDFAYSQFNKKSSSQEEANMVIENDSICRPEETKVITKNVDASRQKETKATIEDIGVSEQEETDVCIGDGDVSEQVETNVMIQGGDVNGQEETNAIMENDSVSRQEETDVLIKVGDVSGREENNMMNQIGDVNELEGTIAIIENHELSGLEETYVLIGDGDLNEQGEINLNIGNDIVCGHEETNMIIESVCVSKQEHIAIDLKANDEIIYQNLSENIITFNSNQINSKLIEFSSTHPAVGSITDQDAWDLISSKKGIANAVAVTTDEHSASFANNTINNQGTNSELLCISQDNYCELNFKSDRGTSENGICSSSDQKDSFSDCSSDNSSERFRKHNSFLHTNEGGQSINADTHCNNEVNTMFSDQRISHSFTSNTGESFQNDHIVINIDCSSEANSEYTEEVVTKNSSPKHSGTSTAIEQTSENIIEAARVFKKSKSRFFCDDDFSPPHLSKIVKKEGNIPYLDKQIPFEESESNGTRFIEIGHKKSGERGKAILLLGATGSGKTTFVNLCLNFYFGAQNADDKKLFIADTKLKTDRVSVYTFYPTEDNLFPLTVIDTPGLNDSTGAEIHDHVDALKSFLALACSYGLKINALGFVAQAHLVRLTSSEKLVMDYVKSSFGTDVEKHIIAMVTFSDNQPTPPIIEAMERYGFMKPFFVKFNNTLLISETEQVDDLDEIYWRTGIRSWKKCLKQLKVMEPLSRAAVATIQNDVFNRSILQKYINNLSSEITTLTMMVGKKNCLRYIYNNDNIRVRVQRKNVWYASNIAFSLQFGAGTSMETKEMFLTNVAKALLDGNFDILLYLLLDKESSMMCVLKSIIGFVLKYCKFFDTAKFKSCLGTSFHAQCFQCEKKCSFDRLKGDLIKFKCLCGHPGGFHVTPNPVSDGTSKPSNDFLKQKNFKRKVLSTAAHLIKQEISKYQINDESWNLSQLFQALVYNEPDYLRKDIKYVYEVLAIFLKGIVY